ncbi:MAG TPA: ferritin-like domain-containing protein [Bryobacteraceae bacterium]|jgi:ferritin-like metal-binding protein YciE
MELEVQMSDRTPGGTPPPNQEKEVMENLKDLLIEELKDLYSAEQQIIKALPKMVKGAQSEELKNAFSEHLEVTKTHAKRIEEAFGHLEQKPKAKLCKGMEGLLAEGAETLEEEKAGTLRDLEIIGAAQRVEHYEMAAYGTARAIAEQLQLDEVVELLNQTYSEEEEADSSLSEVAESLYGEVNGESNEDEEDTSDEETEKAPAMSAKSASSQKPKAMAKKASSR